MKAYKGFDENLKCRDFQYEIGKEYEETNAKLCEAGFHACENPIDAFGYYTPANSRYCEVELEDVTDESSDDSKKCGKRIHINAEIGIKGIVDAFIKFTLDHIPSGNHASTNTGNHSASTNTGYRSASTNTGDWSASTNTGDRSASTNTGDRSASTNTGNHSASTNTGDRSASTNTGYQSASTNTGDHSASTNTGDRSASTNTGNRSASTNTGNHSASTNTGDYSAAIVTGDESVAIATGIYGKAKGSIGCYLVIAEWKMTNGEWHIVDVKSTKVDGVKIKADIFYRLVDGKFVEVEGEEK